MAERKITKELFDAAMILYKGGAKTTEVSRYLGISESTARRMRQSGKYEKYDKYRNDLNERMKAKKQKEKTKLQPIEEPEAVQVDFEDAFWKKRMLGRLMDQNEKTDEMIKTLKLISEKMAYIVEQLS